MRLRNASSPTQCVFAMRLRLPNASSQCVCATQCVFTMRLRHPMRLHNASAPAMRLRLPMRLHPMRLQIASAPANASAPIGPFFDECVFAMRMRLQVVYHTPAGRRNPFIHLSINSSIHSFISSFKSFLHSVIHATNSIQFNSIHSVHSTHSIHSIHSIQLISQTFIQSFIRPSIHSSNMHAFIHRFFLSFISFKFSLYPPTCMFIHLILGPL